MIVITLAAELLILTAVGYFMQKIKLVKEDFDSQLTNFLLCIAFPCLIFNSIVAEPFSVDTLKKCGIVLIVSVLVCLIQLALGQIYYLLSGKNGSGRLTRFGMVFVHYSFFGIPIMEGLFGSTGTMYYSVFLIPVRIFYYSLTKSMLLPEDTGGNKEPFKTRLKKIILNPCLLAVVIGLIFWVGGISLPEVFSYCVTSLAKVCSPMGLILCGCTLGKYDLKKLLNIRYIKLPVIRTIILPALFFGISRIMIAAGFDITIAKMMVIYTALPVASMMAAFTVKYDPDKETQFEAAGSVFLATIMSMVTLPLWYLLLEHI